MYVVTACFAQLPIIASIYAKKTLAATGMLKLMGNEKLDGNNILGIFYNL